MLSFILKENILLFILDIKQTISDATCGENRGNTEKRSWLF